MKHNHRYSVLTTLTLLLWATFSFAQPTIPQAVLDEIDANGVARIIVGLDVPWQPEGFLRLDAIATQRSAIATTQDDFVETFNNDLANDSVIDDPQSPGGEPTIPAQRTFSTIPYLVMKVSRVTLPYVQQNVKTTSIELSTVDEPSLQDSLPLIGADKALQKGYGGKGQLIAIVDTGVDKNHPFFSPSRVVDEACFSVTNCPNGKLEQTKETTGAAVPCDFDLDGCDHGTHVAGIAASVAKEAKIVAVQSASDFGTAKFYLEDQLAALDWLQEKYGYHDSPLAAVNMSLGSGENATTCDDDARTQAIQNLHSVGIATIASAGNEGINGITAPACISEVISVGATDKTNQLWDKSNRADILDLLAPGVNIESAIPGGGTEAKSGTSMAVPHVAGTWALLKAAYPDKNIAEILALLKDSGQVVNGTPLLQLEAALPPPPLTDGLLLHLECEDNVQDSSGSNNHGIAHGNLSYVDGKIGKACHLTSTEEELYDFYGVYSGSWQGTGETGNNVLGDFNGDGKSDMASYSGPNSWHVCLSTGRGFACDYWEGHAGGISNNVLADFNGDGKSDMAGYSGVSGKNWHVCLSTGSNFTCDFWHGHYGNTSNNAIGDFNGDGKSDLAGYSEVNSSWHVCLSTGSKFACDYWQIPDGRISNNISGDFNGDGKSDIASYTGTNVNWNVCLSTGSGFTCNYWHGHASGMSNNALGDFNGDGKTDIAGYTGANGNWDVCLSTGNGFTCNYWHGHTGGTSNNTLGDFNGDGKTDIASGEYTVGQWLVCLSTGNDFSCQYKASHSGGTIHNATADFNGDGKTDLAGYTGHFGEWAVMLANTFAKDHGYVQVKHSSTLNVNHHTLAAWVKVPESSSGGILIGKVNPLVHETIDLRVHSSTESNYRAIRTIFAVGSEIHHNGGSSSPRLETGKWHFVAMTYDGEKIAFYIDGVLDETHPRTGTVRTNTNDLAIGRHGGDSDQRGHDSVFRGSMDEVRLYNRALSEAEIQTLYSTNITPCTQWNPVTDYLSSSQPENPYRDSCGKRGVWHLMQSSTLERNPQNYSLLPNYTNGFGISVNHPENYDWAGDFVDTASSVNYPFVSLNYENTVVTHPIFDQFAIIGWQSPIDGTVEITGSVKSLGGITWFIDQGTTNLASGMVLDSATQSFQDGDNGDNGNLNSIEIRQNELLYFIIDPRSDYNSCVKPNSHVHISNCDTTELDISIKLVENDQPSENSLTVNKAGGRGTLSARPKGEESNLVCKSDCTDASEIYPLDSPVILTARPEKGFIFNGWSGDCSGTETRLTFTMDGAKTCTAQFELDPNQVMHQLTINTVGDGMVASRYIDCGENCTAYYRLNQWVTLEATPNADNLFIGWTGDCTGLKPKMTFKMEAAKNCTATFKPKPTGALTLRVEKQGEGQAVITGRFNGERTLYCDKSCQQASDDYAAGDQVILSARALKGFIFTEWTGDCSGTEPRITVLMDDAKNCTAQIDLDPNVVWYELTINNVGTGKGSVTASGSDCTETRCTLYYQPDKVVRLTATRALFSEFVGWSGDCEGTKTAKLTMTEDLTCTAEFKSEFEIFVEQMVDAFYANATLDNGDSVTTLYPQNADNRARLKEAFWLNLATLMQTDQHLGISDSQLWPNQLNGTEWLPPDANTEYTQSIQIQPQDFVGIKVELLNNVGQAETIPVIIYYSDAMPVIDDGGGWYSVRGAYFSRYAFRRW